MKNYIKLLLGALIMFLAAESYAKDSITVTIPNSGIQVKAAVPDKLPEVNVPDVNGSIVYNDTKTFMGKYIDRADTLVTKALSHLGYGIEEGWNIVVRQQRINALVYLTYWLLELFLIYRLVIFFKSNYKQGEDNSNVIGFTGVMSVILLGIGIYNSSNLKAIYTGLFNPEYAALQELYNIGLSLLK